LRFLEDNEDRDLEQKIIQGAHKLTSGAGIITVDMVKDRQDDKPLDAAAFKTEFSTFDVAQKLFKEEIGEYDKKHRDTSDLRSMGTRTKLVRSWYNALSPDVHEELRLVAEKWNQEGAHSDAKDRYVFNTTLLYLGKTHVYLQIPQPTPEENHGGLHKDGRKNYGFTCRHAHSS
jgi:hypothetical protein